MKHKTTQWSLDQVVLCNKIEEKNRINDKSKKTKQWKKNDQKKNFKAKKDKFKKFSSRRRANTSIVANLGVVSMSVDSLGKKNSNKIICFSDRT